MEWYGGCAGREGWCRFGNEDVAASVGSKVGSAGGEQDMCGREGTQGTSTSAVEFAKHSDDNPEVPRYPSRMRERKSKASARRSRTPYLQHC